MTATHNRLASWSGLVRALSWLPVLPGVIAHEATHAVAGWLLGAETAWSRVEGRPAVAMTWPAGTGWWRVRLAHLAPLVATPLAMFVAHRLTLAGYYAAGSWSMRWAWLLLVLVNFLVFVVPSVEDLRPGGDG